MGTGRTGTRSQLPAADGKELNLRHPKGPGTRGPFVFSKLWIGLIQLEFAASKGFFHVRFLS